MLRTDRGELQLAGREQEEGSRGPAPGFEAGSWSREGSGASKHIGTHYQHAVWWGEEDAQERRLKRGKGEASRYC